MTTTSPAVCRCGTAKASNGTCSHCDGPPPIKAWFIGGDGKEYPIRTCPTGCVKCNHRDSHCEMCGHYRSTPARAAYCATQDRKAEALRESQHRKP